MLDLSERPSSFFFSSSSSSSFSSLPDITCQLVSAVRLAGLHLPHHLPARDCSETRRTSSAASLDCTCQFLIAVGLAGLLQCDSFCGPRRTFTARKSLWASPDFLRLEIAVGSAGLFAPRKNAERMSDKNVRSGCQKKCQRECQMECQIKCQR